MYQVVVEVTEDVDVCHIHVPDLDQDQEAMIDTNQVIVGVNHSLLPHIDLRAIGLIQEVVADK
jgi:hypothetical protein